MNIQPEILIPSLASAACFQVSLFFLLLWMSHKDEVHLRTFSIFTAFISVMVLSALLLQKADGPNAPFIGLLAYRIQLAAICGTVSTLLRLSSQISNLDLPIALQGARLWKFAIVPASLAWTPLVLHLPPSGTLVSNYDEADRGPLFVPFVLLMVLGVSYAALILWHGVQAQRQQPEGELRAGTSYFGDLRLFLAGVLLFLPTGIYEIVLAMGWIGQPSNMPNARSFSVIALCGLTGQMLINGIVENDRRKRRAEMQSRVYLDTMSYAAHQVRGNIDNILWLLRSSLQMQKQHDAHSPEQKGVEAAIEEANELLRIFNTMLLAARDAAGQAMNLGPKRTGNLSEFVEQHCRTRIGSACKAKGWNGSGDALYALCFYSELTEPLLFSRDAIQHIMSILIDNAIKYSEGGKSIYVRLRQENNQVHIQVRDCGIGIPAGGEELIFSPYNRGTAAEHNISGNGIGLSLARRLAESLGGALRAESDGIGLGSTFLLTFPLETEE